MADKGHAVRLYRDDAELCAAVVPFVAEGVERREPVVLVVTAAHARQFADGLGELGWDSARLERDGRLVFADADETLLAILHDGVPSPDAFEAAIGGLLDGGTSGPVRVFGEMVDVLARRGDVHGAAVLEELWNRLRATRPFSLLCAYRVDVFDPEVQTSLLPDVCLAHTRVEVGDDPGRFREAVDAALTETLGPGDAQKVWALVAEEIRDGRVPAAELALMWVSTHMPYSAARVLERARERYAPVTP